MMIDDFTIDYSFKYKKNKMDEKALLFSYHIIQMKILKTVIIKMIYNQAS